MHHRLVAVLLACFALSFCLEAGEPVPKEVVKQTIDAVGGEAKLLKLFRFKENLVLGADPKGKPTERTSVMEPPGHWWVGGRDRAENEPGAYLVWAWTLAPLLDPKSKLETLPAIKISDRPVYGIKVTGTITPPMSMYFDQETKLLARIDWRNEQNVFSEWKEADGAKYAARCSGYRGGVAWFHTEIVELTRLKELPAGLKR